MHVYDKAAEITKPSDCKHRMGIPTHYGARLTPEGGLIHRCDKQGLNEDKRVSAEAARIMILQIVRWSAGLDTPPPQKA